MSAVDVLAADRPKLPLTTVKCGRSLRVGYMRDAAGEFWIFNDQRGYVRAGGRALEYALALEAGDPTKAARIKAEIAVRAGGAK